MPASHAPARFACRVGRTRLDLLDQPAADDHRVGFRGNRLRTRRIADAEADADGQLHMPADLRELRPHVRVSR